MVQATPRSNEKPHSNPAKDNEAQKHYITCPGFPASQWWGQDSNPCLGPECALSATTPCCHMYLHHCSANSPLAPRQTR